MKKIIILTFIYLFSLPAFSVVGDGGGGGGGGASRMMDKFISVDRSLGDTIADAGGGNKSISSLVSELGHGYLPSNINSRFENIFKSIKYTKKLLNARSGAIDYRERGVSDVDFSTYFNSLNNGVGVEIRGTLPDARVMQ